MQDRPLPEHEHQVLEFTFISDFCVNRKRGVVTQTKKRGRVCDIHFTF